ncbi:MAG: Homoserine dehydrogenase [Verrucomicrobiota bacterium]|jgi:homoserine dehydrogenase
MSSIRIGLVGLGTVGTGVARILTENAEGVRRQAGKSLEIAHVVVGDPGKARRIDLPPGLIRGDLEELIADRECRIAVLLVGGLEPARSIALRLLASGKDLITANKALLAEHGSELFDAARAQGRSIAFEAAVAGGIPIITNMSQCLSANRLEGLRGILNGTTNFILTCMEEKSQDFAVALKEAQRLGYAEADPAMDVDGSDAAQKLAILAHLGFGARASWREIPRLGIDGLSPLDIAFARELGCRIKLIASARLDQGRLALGVSPALVRFGSPLAEVRQAFNAVSLRGDAVGELFYQGQGAGEKPTASAVVADIIDTAVGRAQITFGLLQLWSDQRPAAELADASQTKSRFYIRLTVADNPGVLAVITGILGAHLISIASFLQKEAAEASGAPVTLVLMTHVASQAAATAAIKAIDQLPVTRAPSLCLPVVD